MCSVRRGVACTRVSQHMGRANLRHRLRKSVQQTEMDSAGFPLFQPAGATLACGLWVKNRYPNRNPGKYSNMDQNLRSISWWFSLDPHHCVNQQKNSDAHTGDLFSFSFPGQFLTSRPEATGAICCMGNHSLIRTFRETSPCHPLKRKKS